MLVSNTSVRNLLIFLALFGVALLNALPYLLYDIGGDKLVHYIFLECYGDAFWRGELYPRWCMETNSGLGGPLFYFYFPGAYWITSLFIYPLQAFGASFLDMIRLSALLATLVTTATTYLWLRHHAAPKIAVLLTALFLFSIYRVEVFLPRSAIAELWCIAWIPLMMLIAERMLDDARRWPWLGLSLSLALVTHAPVAIMAAIFIGLYLLLMAQDKKRIVIAGIKAALLAIVVASIYLLPALYYHQYTQAATEEDLFNAWPNRALLMRDIWGDVRPLKYRVLFATIMGWLVALGFYLLLWIRYRRAMEPKDKKEFYVWGIVMLAIWIILLPPTNVLLEAVPLLQAFIFPWRGQVVFALGFTMLVGYWAKYKPNAAKTVTFDLIVLIGMLTLISQFLVQQFDFRGGRGTYDKLVKSRVMNSYEHTPIWVDPDHRLREYFFDLNEKREKKPLLAETLLGNEAIGAVALSPNHITVPVEVKSEHARMRVYQRYFPSWAVDDASAAAGVKLEPEDKSGLMLLTIPKGEHSIRLHHNIYGANAPWWVRLSPWLSLIGLVAAIYLARRTVLTGKR